MAATPAVDLAPPGNDPLCARQWMLEQRCAHSRGDCLSRADYTYCVAIEPLYRPERASIFLGCYPANIGCDNMSGITASSCTRIAEDQLPVSASLTQLANNLCQRCPGYANDQASDVMTCVTNTTTNATSVAQDLRFLTDAALDQLNTCLVNASPPADGCVAFTSCYQSLFPSKTNPCRDGGV